MLPVASLHQPDPRPSRGEPREVSGAVSQIRLEDDPNLLSAVFLAHLLEQADCRLDVAGLLHVDPHERVHLTRAVQHSPQLGSAEVRPNVESDLGELHGDVGVEPGRVQSAERRNCLVGGRDRLRLAPDVRADVVQRALDAFGVECPDHVEAGLKVLTGDEAPCHLPHERNADRQLPDGPVAGNSRERSPRKRGPGLRGAR